MSLLAEIQGERLYVISLVTPLSGNSFGPLTFLNVYARGNYIAGKHEALGMGPSYTCRGPLCTENEVYHFDNPHFKIGEDEVRIMSPSRRVLLETGYEVLQRGGLVRASVGLAFQALCLLYEASTHPEGYSRRILPSPSSTCSSLSSPTRGEKVNRGVWTSFPGAAVYEFPGRGCVSSSSLRTGTPSRSPLHCPFL